MTEPRSSTESREVVDGGSDRRSGSHQNRFHRLATSLVNMTVLASLFVVVLAAALPLRGVAEPLIADHRAVNFCTNLTAADIARVTRLWISYAGESHSLGVRTGCLLLTNVDSRFQVAVQDAGTPEAATTNHLRVSRATWGDVRHTTGWQYGYGEEDWYTSASAIAQTKLGLYYCAANGPHLDVLAFGWCWDMKWHNGVGGGTNVTYGTRWAGSSADGPDGDLRWGLTSADDSLTGNRICMDTYLDATEQYRIHSRTSGCATAVIFTTGPVDGLSGDEESYQLQVKNQSIRDYASNTADGILFDYADILCWDNAGVQNTRTWMNYNSMQKTFPAIAADNMLDMNGGYVEDGDHIGQRGALRLAKALWWMLAAITEPPPTLDITQSGNSFVIRFIGVPGKAYPIQYSDDLDDAGWIPLGAVSASESGVCQFAITPPPGVMRRFYRAVYH